MCLFSVSVFILNEYFLLVVPDLNLMDSIIKIKKNWKELEDYLLFRLLAHSFQGDLSVGCQINLYRFWFLSSEVFHIKDQWILVKISFREQKNSWTSFTAKKSFVCLQCNSWVEPYDFQQFFFQDFLLSLKPLISTIISYQYKQDKVNSNFYLFLCKEKMWSHWPAYWLRGMASRTLRGFSVFFGKRRTESN